MRPINRHQKNGQRGVAIVEFALIVPVMLMLMLVVTEFASGIRTHQILNNAAREGARVAILPENSPINGSGGVAAARAAAVAYAAANGVTLAAANVVVNQSLLVPTAGGVGITASQVTVTYNYSLTDLPNFGAIAPVIPMSVSVEFKNFY